MQIITPIYTNPVSNIAMQNQLRTPLNIQFCSTLKESMASEAPGD